MRAVGRDVIGWLLIFLGAVLIVGKSAHGYERQEGRTKDRLLARWLSQGADSLCDVHDVHNIIGCRDINGAHDMRRIYKGIARNIQLRSYGWKGMFELASTDVGDVSFASYDPFPAFGLYFGCGGHDFLSITKPYEGKTWFQRTHLKKNAIFAFGFSPIELALTLASDQGPGSEAQRVAKALQFGFFFSPRFFQFSLAGHSVRPALRTAYDLNDHGMIGVYFLVQPW